MTILNPFRDAIVATAWNGTFADVPQIHAVAFEKCLRGLEHVRETQHSTGLLLHGAPGSGKTHLLGRLRQFVTTTQPISTECSDSLFVWVRLQTSPRAIWRHLRRKLVEDWFRPVPNGKAQFERVLYQRLAEVRPAAGDLEHWVDYMQQEDPQGLERALDEIADAIDLDRNTLVAFKHLAFDRYRRELRAWLSGDSLPEAALDRLDLAAEEGSEEDREQQARQVVLMLCLLAGPNLPIALCFDQVEALQISAEDREGLYAFGQLVSTLHDETRNVLIVSCVQTAYAFDLKTKSRGADYDRVQSCGAFALETLTREQSETLIRARLLSGGDRADWPQTPLWPLSADELQKLSQPGDLTPRRLLTHCAARFDAWTERLMTDAATPEVKTPPTPSPPPRIATAAFLASYWETRHEQIAGTNEPAHTDGIVRDGLPLLLRILAPELKAERDDVLPDVSLIFSGPRGKSGVSLCTQSNMTSLANLLKKLKQQLGTGRLARLVILRDSRVPISPGAKKTAEYLEELRKAGAVIVHPPIEAFVALEVLRGLLADAKSGDLANGDDVISQPTVEAWLHAHLPSSLLDLSEMLSPTSPPNAGGDDEVAVLEEIAALLLESPVMSLDDIVRGLRRPSVSVRTTIERHPEQFRVLNGPPVVVFRVA